MSTLFAILISATSIFLILLILVQRGRGGGLTGALGGMGGQSAFGTKSGDVFTKITVWTTFMWIVVLIAAVKMLGTEEDPLAKNLGSNVVPPVEGAMDIVPETGDVPPADTGFAPSGATDPVVPPTGNDEN